MPDYNTPPGDLTTGDLGQIVTQRGGRIVTTYQITPLDYAYFAQAVFKEGGPPFQVSWAMIQMFGARYTSGKYRSTSPPTAGFKRCIETYCAPVNPVYTYTGEHNFSRATTPCGTIRANNGRGRLLYPGTPTTGAGSAPQVMRSRRGIPGPPLTSVWNRIHCKTGQAGSAHDWESEDRRARRRRNIDLIFEMLYGSKQTAWNTISANVRLTCWEVCNALVGNPIPGFDGWAACSQFTPNRRRRRPQAIVDIPGENVQQNEQVARNYLSSHPGVRTGFRFASTGNCMVYRADMRTDDVVYTQRTSEGNTVSSLRRPVPALNSRTGAGGAIPAPSLGTGAVIATTTSQGLAPTAEVPESAAAVTESTLGGESVLIGALEEWASGMETRLTETFGGGRSI